jgi:2-polyprenyl-6-methoxyphenol hydroxylase-like FAD-dependent oxidoreductase
LPAGLRLPREGTLRQGRALLADDAAHVYDRIGSMGLNDGFQDAATLAGKLRVMIANVESDCALDLYDFAGP